MSTGSDPAESLEAPSLQQWSDFGLTSIEEVQGGYQSRVFRARRGGADLAVKLTDGRRVDRKSFGSRLLVVKESATVNPQVVGPLPTGSDLVQPLGPWLVVTYPWIEGASPDPREHPDVTRMAEALARLHRSLRGLGCYDLPPLAALRAQPVDAATLPGELQLLHGDFSAANVLFGSDSLAIIDFDDCGYGPVEFEIANTLFMELFDAAMDDEPARYTRFRAWFVDAYRAEASTSIDDTVLDRAVDIRFGALCHWLDHPGEAPIGIRTSTPEWRRRLRAFVDARS